LNGKETKDIIPLIDIPLHPSQNHHRILRIAKEELMTKKR